MDESFGYQVAAIAEWSTYRIETGLVMSPVPLKTRRVGQRFTLNLSRAETSSRWCGVVAEEIVNRHRNSIGRNHIGGTATKKEKSNRESVE
ncbi:hypothetical protein TNCV_542751 [Trichonephila clavipes]|nr:hypothetical protein TNCV_542751 [Trichonephila clavipes]